MDHKGQTRPPKATRAMVHGVNNRIVPALKPSCNGRLPRRYFMKGSTKKMIPFDPATLGMNADKNWTYAMSGVYRVKFHDVQVDSAPPRRKCDWVLRFRFNIVAGPIGSDSIGAPSTEYAGRLIAIWHDLDPNPDGVPSISPNWWLAGAILRCPGNNLLEQVEAFGRSVEFLSVVNRQKDKRPRTSKVIHCRTATGFDYSTTF